MAVNARKRRQAVGGMMFASLIVVGGLLYLYGEHRVNDDANWHSVPGRTLRMGFKGDHGGRIPVSYTGLDGQSHTVDWEVSAGSVQYLIDGDPSVTVYLFKTLLGRQHATVCDDLAACKGKEHGGLLGGIVALLAGLGLLAFNVQRFRGKA